MARKVLILANNYPPHFVGGAELIAHYQAKALQRLGYEVRAFVGDGVTRADRYTLWEDRYDGLPVYRIVLQSDDFDNRNCNFQHDEVDHQFEAVVDEFRPDVVHAHNLLGLSVGILKISKQMGLKTIVTLHDHWGFCFKNTILLNNEKVCTNFHGCSGCRPTFATNNGQQARMNVRNEQIFESFEAVDTFISPSKYLAGAYARAGLPISKLRVIWYGIDVHRYDALRRVPRERQIRFTFVGYLGRHKGLHILLEAADRLKMRDDFLLNIVGVGDRETEVKQYVEKKGISDIVRFHGRIDNYSIESVYQATDVLILPSIWPENQPVTICEAMACRIPIIASRLGGSIELVKDGTSGLLFEPANAKDLADKMRMILDAPEQIESMGEAARRVIASYPLERQVAKIARIYEGRG